MDMVQFLVSESPPPPPPPLFLLLKSTVRVSSMVKDTRLEKGKGRATTNRTRTQQSNRDAVAALLQGEYFFYILRVHQTISMVCSEHEKLNDAREWGMAALRKEIECLLAGGEEASNSDLYETDSEPESGPVLQVIPPQRVSTPPPSYASGLPQVTQRRPPSTPQRHPPTHQPQPTVTPQRQAVTRTPRGGHRKQWEAYVVYHGRSVGAFGSWRQVEAIIKDDKNSVIKGFESLSLAKQSYQLASTSGVLNAISFQPQTGMK
ncbi:hypothetical protein D9758_003819 [Tetrapyrgos nigripes]|uniref:Ribonuclease H1 N-terminal domain-containing protein n=1 Tax=Tetrapyrgos nigripes TaxID=182062 RepID=A0A8H5GM79_9AGAR|nr:hypothetical protein D9758_003819 [Tetrapyrgos nigripes]